MRFEINDCVSYTELHGEIVLANIETGKYFSIGGSGKHIWELLLKSEEVENIIDTLAQQLQADKQVLSEDVHEFLNNLENHKFIQKRVDKVET